LACNKLNTTAVDHLSKVVKMTEVVFLFELHQPRRFKRQLGRSSQNDMPGLAEEIYFDDKLNRDVLDRVAMRAYLPALKSIARSIKEDGFRCALGISGVLMEQCMWWNPKILELVRDLVKTGACELVAQPYFRTLASVFDLEEMAEQVEAHRKALNTAFGVNPTIAGNTDFIYNNKMAKKFASMGFKAVLTEGVESALSWRSPNHVYNAKDSGIPLLMRNGMLSDDIGFRYSAADWSEWPLTPEKYSDWLSKVDGDVIFIALDLAAFGEHHLFESGINNFLSSLPKEISKHGKLSFATPSEVVGTHASVGDIDVDESATISWADHQKDTSAWLGNDMQRYCLDVARYMQPVAKKLGGKYLRMWRLLTTSDHFYYMNAKGEEARGAGAYFSPYNSAIKAFLTFNWVLSDYRQRLYGSAGDNISYYRMLDGRLPAGHLFRFYSGFTRPEGSTARNLRELLDAIKVMDAKVLEFNVIRGDLSRWVGEVLGCSALSLWLDSLRQKGLPDDIKEAMAAEVERAIMEAESRLGKMEKDSLETR
jgi:alpha-amylase